jgi:hypothetical protein
MCLQKNLVSSSLTIKINNPAKYFDKHQHLASRYKLSGNPLKYLEYFKKELCEIHCIVDL